MKLNQGPLKRSSSLLVRIATYTNFNYTFDTRRKVEFMVEEVVIGKKENAKPLSLWNFEN